MASRATGYYRPGDSWLHRRSPITKLFAFGWLLVAAFILPSLSLIALAGLVLVMAASTGLLRPLLRSLRIPLVLIASILVVNALFFPAGHDVLGAIGPFSVTREGLAFGLVSAGRIGVIFIASVLFLFTTLADDLLEALVARGVDHRLAFVVLSAVQMIPRLQARANQILDAQQARGLPISGSIWTRTRAVVPLVGPLLLGALIDAHERTLALEARSFGSRRTRTAYRLVADPPIDRWLRAGILVGLVAVVVAAITGLGA
jgi:energy-coupling factor transport system permease protein